MGLLSTIGLTPVLYARGGAGAPSIVSGRSLRGRLESYEDTVAATFGFESCRLSYVATLDEILEMLTNGLMMQLIIYGPDAETVWEGAITTIEGQIGQEPVSLSLDTMANRVRIRYTTVLGTPAVTSPLSDADSQALYGVKDIVIGLSESTATEAANVAIAQLAELKNPRSPTQSTIASGELGESRLTLIGTGWYGMLDWLFTSDTSTATVETTTQVEALITAYNSTNNFFSDNFANVTASGISATELIPDDTSYREKIEKLLSQGNGTHRLAWGIYEGRKLTVQQWAGASPSTITYQRHVGSGQMYAASGGVLMPWQVRPDAMYQVAEFIDPGPVSTAQDAAARKYIERVRRYVEADRMGVDVEPAATSSLDARLARIGG